MKGKVIIKFVDRVDAVDERDAIRAALTSLWYELVGRRPTIETIVRLERWFRENGSVEFIEDTGSIEGGTEQ